MDSNILNARSLSTEVKLKREKGMDSGSKSLIKATFTKGTSKMENLLANAKFKPSKERSFKDKQMMEI